MNIINQANFQSLHDWLNNNEHYLGMRIFYSPILIEPKYLLIGINPGTDNFINHYQDTGSKLLDLGEMDEGLHYVVYIHEDKNSRCRIGKSICRIFELAGKFDELKNNTMKINCHFAATYNAGILRNKLMSDMNEWAKNTHCCHYDEAQAKIIWQIIKFIKPKYIILEGKRAFTDLNKFAKKADIPYILKDYNSKLVEAEYDINSEQKILGVHFKRKVYGLDKKFETDMVNWVKEH